MTKTGHIVFSEMEEVIYGQPAAEAAAACAERLGARRILLMVSGTLNRNTDEIDTLKTALGDRVIGTFDKMPQHTPRTAVIAATRMARHGNADLILTLGGGSITDGAKAVQLCLANDIETAADLDRLRVDPKTGSIDHVRPPSVRQISIPTTLSGGEFSALSGVTDTETKKKELFRHPRVIPQIVILDPAVTRHTPEWLFLSTGIRAVDHCVEGICSGEANPFGDAHALKGLELLAGGLPRVKADPGDMAARLDCQIGTWLSMGPIAAGVPMGASHGIGYILGARHGIPHGHASCIMLPAVMAWNKPVNADRQAMIAAAMGRPGEDAGTVLAALIAGLGQPRTLAEVDVGEDDLAAIAKGAMATPWVPRNPRPIPEPAQVLEILKLAKPALGAGR